MSNKRVLIVFFGLLLLVSIIFVSAAVYQPSTDIIVRLSADTNAHGQKYTGFDVLGLPVYTSEIKYSTIFGAPYVGSPYACTGNNVVLRLSGETNGWRTHGRIYRPTT